MKTFKSIIVLIVTFLLVFSCSDNQIVTSPESNDSPSKGSLAKANPVVAIVTGSGQSHRPSGAWAGVWRTFSFNARKYADGTVEGMFQGNNHGKPSKFKGVITCFEIDGNEAWIGGIMNSNGTLRGFRVVDNGEGSNASSDQISYVGNVQNNGFKIWVDEIEYCNDQLPWPGLVEIEGGNVQIRN